MSDPWTEFDEYCAELEAAGAAEDERRAAMTAGLETLRPALDLLHRQHGEFEVEALLNQASQRLFGGIAVIERVTTSLALNVHYALQWPAFADPRPDRRTADGEYAVQIWLGLDEQGRASVRVAGERRLQARLPVSIERFRAVLLTALREPAFIAAPETSPPEPESEAAAPAGATGPEAGSSAGTPAPDSPSVDGDTTP